VVSGSRVSSFLPVTRGVHLGSVLGPLLFSIYVNDLPNVLSNCPYEVHMYADHVQIYVNRPLKQLNKCIDACNSDLDKIAQWTKENSLGINPKKSKCLVTYKKSQLPGLHICGSLVEYVTRHSLAAAM